MSLHLGMAECHVSFSGHCDLDNWPIFFLIIVSEAYLSYHLRYNPQIWCVHASWDEKCNVPFLGHCDLHLWPSLKNWH